MIIGTVRPEEAKAHSSEAGYHQFHNDDGEPYGSFEVFWDDADTGPWSDEPRNYDADGEAVKPGWYWWSCFPGCLPESDAIGPFANSIDARYDADENCYESPME